MNDLQDYQTCAGRLKAIADAERLRIVEALFRGAMNVTQLSEHLNEQIVKVSHHLGVLRNANVVQTQKQGRFVVYSLHPDVMAEETHSAQDRKLDFGCCSLDLDNV